MIRKAASKFLILAAVTLASGAVAVNCSKKSDKDDIGSVGLALVLPGGGIVNTVTYSINTTPPITGTIDVSAAGTTTATALVSGLAPGSYIVTMNAMGTNPTQTCMGSAPFTVLAGQTAIGDGHPAVQPDPPERLGRDQRPVRPVPLHHVASRRPRSRASWAARRSTSAPSCPSSTRATPSRTTGRPTRRGSARSVRRVPARPSPARRQAGPSFRSRCLTASAATA